MPEFGDLLRYPEDQEVGDKIVFMYLGQEDRWDVVQVLVLRTLPDDDQWEPGTLVTAGVRELIPYVPA